MSDELICRYCKHFERNESYCNRLETTKSAKSNCDEFVRSKFADIR